MEKETINKDIALQNATTEVDHLKEVVRNATTEVEHLKAVVRNATTEVEHLKEVVRNCSNQCNAHTEMKNTSDKLESAVENVTSARSGLEHRVSYLGTTAVHQGIAIASVNATLSSEERNISDIQTKVSVLETTVTNITNKWYENDGTE